VLGAATSKIQCFPFLPSEPDENEIVSDKDGPLHQHAVPCDQLEELFVGQEIDGVLQTEFLVLLAVGVHELLFVDACDLLPRKKFFRSGSFLHDVTDFKINASFIQPNLGLACSASAWVVYKNERHSVLLVSLKCI